MTQNQFHTQIQQGISQYNQPKDPNDPDLVFIVQQILTEAGLGLKLPEAFNNHRFIIEAVGKHSTVQRYLLNRYWNNQLMFAKNPSVEERFCLIHNGAISDWIGLFKDKVLPFIIENDLPVRV